MMLKICDESRRRSFLMFVFDMSSEWCEAELRWRVPVVSTLLEVPVLRSVSVTFDSGIELFVRRNGTGRMDA